MPGKKMILMFLAIIGGVLFLASCESLMSDIKDVEVDGDYMTATYYAKDRGSTNTADFLFSEVFELAHKHPEATKLRLDIVIKAKDGEEIDFGRRDFDLEQIRKYKDKRDFRKNEAELVQEMRQGFKRYFEDRD